MYRMRIIPLQFIWPGGRTKKRAFRSRPASREYPGPQALASSDYTLMPNVLLAS